MLSNDVQQLQECRKILTRQGVRRAARYWSNPAAVFAHNFIGGSVAGVVTILVATVALAIGAHRVGPQSTLHTLLHWLLDIVQTLRALAGQGQP